jgi:hypothetical protein
LYNLTFGLHRNSACSELTFRLYIYSVSAYTDFISTLTFGLHKNSAYSELTFRLYRVSAYIDFISTLTFGLHRNSACSELTFRLYRVSAYIYTLYTHCVCTTDETWYKQLYIHFVYIIHLSNIFMIKHKKKSCTFHWIYYLKKSKQRGTIVYVTNIVTSRHSNNSKIRVRWDFPDGDSAIFTKTSLGFSRIPNLWRHESSSD